MRIAYHLWQPDDGIAEAHIYELLALNHAVIRFLPGDAIPEPVDLIITNGPFGRLTHLGQSLAAIPASRRPKFAILMSEQLWNPRIPDPVGRTIGRFTVLGEDISTTQKNQFIHSMKIGRRLFRDRGVRFRYFGEIEQLQKAGLLSLLVVHSPWIVKFLERNGIKAAHIPNGYSHRWGELRNVERDIPVLWLGKTGTRRRQRTLRQIRSELTREGIDMLVVDGVENPYIFGEARTALLNRTKIALNIVRKPWDSNYLRFILAMTNGTLIVSETMYPHHPFEAGIHFLSSGIPDLVPTIIRALNNNAQRTRITCNAHNYITSKVTLKNSMEQMLSKVDRI